MSVPVPPNPTNTIELVDRLLEEQQDNGWRAHLGASILGDSCRRRLWYTFHWCARANHSGRILRLFRRGHREEQLLLEDLQMTGAEVWPVNPATGDQWRVTFCGGHAGGSLDFVAKGLVEKPMGVAIVECKTAGKKAFDRLSKGGLAAAQPKHLTQCQLYMHFSNQLGGKRIERALYISTNKDDDHRYTEWLHYDAEHAEKAVAKAQTVVDADEPLEKISERPDWYECSWCDYADTCHSTVVPPANCRTCAKSQRGDDGNWYCGQGPELELLTVRAQMRGCGMHLYVPALVPHDQILKTDNAHYVIYERKGKTFANIVDYLNYHVEIDELKTFTAEVADIETYTSAELDSSDLVVLLDKSVQEMRREFAGRFVTADS